MANKITNKNVQVHEECKCGANYIDQESYPIKWADLAKADIKRKKKGLFLHMKLEECESCSTN